MKQKDLLSVGEAAAMLGVCGKTIRSWANSGRLRSIRTIGGHRRFFLEDILKMTGIKE